MARYFHFRLKNPEEFKLFRILDVGSPGHFKIIRGIRKDNNEWDTQAYLIEISDIEPVFVNKYGVVFFRPLNRHGEMFLDLLESEGMIPIKKGKFDFQLLNNVKFL